MSKTLRLDIEISGFMGSEFQKESVDEAIVAQINSRHKKNSLKLMVNNYEKNFKKP